MASEKKRKTARIAVSFITAAAAIGGVVSVKYLSAWQQENMQEIAVSAETPSAACITALQENFSKSAVRQTIPRGNNDPVIVIPGFLTGDAYMSSLAGKISDHGYNVYEWGGGMNTGASAEDVAALEAVLEKAYAENGNKKVSLVGYSLGGVYARELARKYPEKVDKVITLAAPISPAADDEKSLRRLENLYTLFHGDENPQDDAVFREALRTPPPVPVTSLLSAIDMFVLWQEALQPDTKLSENIPIGGGHVFMPFSTEVANIVLDRLAQPQDNWQKISATPYCGEKPQRISVSPPVKPPATPPANP
ncbi:MAG: alpha/beta fold hydrolase [Pseudomonadota bacterium]|nr:alpha/beta fold hydrolase [Pseudomonadota bacterium]QKK04505.1 MAG: alpha/beta fold hydrolase [Pseudomonadota bacterium]